MKLAEKLKNRDKVLYPRIADYIQEAFSHFEDGNTVIIKLRLGTLSQEELKAMTLLADHKS